MLKKRTKTEFPVYNQRGTLEGNFIIRFIIDRLEIDANNVTYHGYYYRINEEGTIIVLDRCTGIWLISDIKDYEPSLPLLGSDVFCFDNVSQRLNEFNQIQFTQEAGINYGTTVDDWEDDI